MAICLFQFLNLEVHVIFNCIKKFRNVGIFKFVNFGTFAQIFEYFDQKRILLLIIIINNLFCRSFFLGNIVEF